jgi:hypothetical protein
MIRSEPVVANVAHLDLHMTYSPSTVLSPPILRHISAAPPHPQTRSEATNDARILGPDMGRYIFLCGWGHLGVWQVTMASCCVGLVPRHHLCS